jgi:hypothetical protein
VPFRITICSALDIHHPTDNTLLWDVVRALTRLVKQRAKALIRIGWQRVPCLLLPWINMAEMANAEHNANSTHVPRSLSSIAASPAHTIARTRSQVVELPGITTERQIAG